MGVAPNAVNQESKNYIAGIILHNLVFLIASFSLYNFKYSL